MPPGVFANPDAALISHELTQEEVAVRRWLDAENLDACCNSLGQHVAINVPPIRKSEALLMEASRSKLPTADELNPLPAIMLPKCGGVVRGLGEKSVASLMTGTRFTPVPFAINPGRSRFGPRSSLPYDTDSGRVSFALALHPSYCLQLSLRFPTESILLGSAGRANVQRDSDGGTV